MPPVEAFKVPEAWDPGESEKDAELLIRNIFESLEDVDCLHDPGIRIEDLSHQSLIPANPHPLMMQMFHNSEEPNLLRDDCRLSEGFDVFANSPTSICDLPLGAPDTIDPKLLTTDKDNLQDIGCINGSTPYSCYAIGSSDSGCHTDSNVNSARIELPNAGRYYFHPPYSVSSILDQISSQLLQRPQLRPYRSYLVSRKAHYQKKPPKYIKHALEDIRDNSPIVSQHILIFQLTG